MNNTWHPFTAMKDWSENPQLSIESADGVYLVDTEANRYIDGTASLWTNVHGHNHPTINAAITKQLSKVAHTTLLGLASPVVDELSAKLVKRAPKGLNHVFYSDSGSTAVEIALKQAFQYWQLKGESKKTKLVHLENAYHGDTLGAVAVGGIDIFHQIFGPLLIPTLSVPSPYQSPARTIPGHSNFSDQSAMVESLTALETLFENQAKEIAAIIVEPLVQGAAGILVHPPGFLSATERLCKQYDVLLIVDEVATGFGRTGRFFACEHENVQPDFLCLAKGITGGYLPLAATLSTDKIYEQFLAPKEEGKTFFHGHTYTGNALACSAALANLQVFEDENTIETLQLKVPEFRQLLEVLQSHPRVGEVRQRGMMVGIELVADKANFSPYPSGELIGHKVCMEARKHGVIIRNLGDVIVLMPPLSITAGQLGTLVQATKDALDTITL